MTKVNEIHLFVDHDTKPLEDSDQFIPSFKAPKNYKKPEAVSEYIDTMAQEFREKAKTLPYLSEFSSGVVLGPDGVVLVHGGALSLLEWFSQAESRLEPDSRYVLVGFDPVGFWESLSSTLAMSGRLSQGRRLPAWFWDYRAHRGLDSLLGVTAHLPRQTILHRLLPDTAAGGIGANPLSRAKTAWRLCLKLWCFDDLVPEVHPSNLQKATTPTTKAVAAKKPLKKLKPLKKK
jgi:hypothetical protein